MKEDTVEASQKSLGAPAAAALVFFASGAVLVLEILSLRLVAPYIGLTLETSTAVIGFALAAIAAGAWLGGRAADAVPPQRLLGPVVLLAGVLVLFVGPVVRWGGEQVRGGGVAAVLLVAALAVFAPAALLSAVTPLVVKLRLATLAETGRVVGRLSGVGTLGALMATFGTGFLLVAAAPTSAILLALGIFLALLGIALTIRLRGLFAAGPMALAMLGGAAATAFAPQPCDLETAYHCARIVPDDFSESGRTLHLDTLRHSYVDLSDPTLLKFSYTRGIASVVAGKWPAAQPLKALHLGGGGVTFPRYLAATRPGTQNLVLEIDGGVVELDIEQLGLRLGDGMDVRVMDARLGLAEQPAESFDLVVGDAFGGLSVPWHLTTKETVSDVRRALRPNGVYALNVIDYPPLGFARAEVATVADVFQHVALVSYPELFAGRAGGNLVIVASDQELPVDAIRDQLARSAPEWDLISDPAGVRSFARQAKVLSDDFAPVDQLLTPYPSAESAG